MNRIVLSGVVYVLLLSLIFCAREGSAAPSTLQTDFLTFTYRSSNHQVLPYRLLPPLHYDPSKKYPLLVWLHGSGQAGTDNVHQLDAGVEQFDASTVRIQYPAFVLVPQCPVNDRWSNMSHAVSPERLRMSANPTRTAQSTFELIGYLQNTYSIDPERISVAGLSLGGFGVWDWLARWPNLFSAGLPMSGGGDSTQAPKLMNKRIWDFHGSADPVVNVSYSRVIIGAIRAAGGTPLYTEIADGGHGPWSPIMRDPAVMAWLFTVDIR